MNDDVALPPPMPRLALADGVMATRLAMRGLPSDRQAPRPRGPNIHASLFPPVPHWSVIWWRENSQRVYGYAKLAASIAQPRWKLTHELPSLLE